MLLKEIIESVLSCKNAAFFYTPPSYKNSYSYIITDPEKEIMIGYNSDFIRKFRNVDELIFEGFSGYSILKYEAGYIFEQKLKKLLPRDKKLIRFFFCESSKVKKIRSSKIKIHSDESFHIKNFKLNTTKNEFIDSITSIKNFIAAGDTYQVNYTIKGKFDFSGSLSALFSTLLFNQSASYSAIIKAEDEIIISLSPELFFEIKGNKITTKPMKGTARRGIETLTDKTIEHQLAGNVKNRAENIMIVDLLRNDLGRISRFGKVKVTETFNIEKYESLFQMVSTIEASLKKNTGISDVLKNIYPCGSITGAPKIKTMQIIKDIEKERRGYYTGSIGLVHKKKSVFNVAIRTILINKKNLKGEIGLGSGIVWDSQPAREYEETILKGKFLTHPVKPFRIFETMKLENGKIEFLDEHIKRMKTSAEFFLFRFDESKIRKKMEKLLLNSKVDDKKRIRITLDKSGTLKTEIEEFPVKPVEIKVILAEKRVSSQNKFQYFKTTNRKLYDSEYRKYSAKGFFDVLFLNKRSELAEGSISNIILKKDGALLTPAVSSGILNGVYRRFLLRQNSLIREKLLTLHDLLSADKIILINSLRGETVVDKLFINEKEFLQMKSLN